MPAKSTIQYLHHWLHKTLISLERLKIKNKILRVKKRARGKAREELSPKRQHIVYF
jgi:hypothetical protein